MNGWNIALSLFYVCWLIVVLIFLWMIWHNGVKRAERIEQALIDAALITATAARQSADTAHTLAVATHATEEHPPV